MRLMKCARGAAAPGFFELSPDDHFPQLIARQEKLHRAKFVEQLFETAIIEVVYRARLIAGCQRHDL